MQHNLLAMRPMCALRRFRDECDGTLSLEAAIVAPVLCMLYVSAFVWFDAIRTQNLNLKAAYTISDMVSREHESIDSSYFNGLDSVFGYLTREEHSGRIRVSTLKCTENCTAESGRTLEVCWSLASDGMAALTNGDLGDYNAITPIFQMGDTLILTETFLDYTPDFNAGLDAETYRASAFTRPRVAGQIKFEGSDGTVDCFSE